MNSPTQLIFTVLFILGLSSACKESAKTISSQATPERHREITETDYYFEETVNIDSPNGPKNITRNILQDKNGIFWLASWEGIISYDGTGFTNHTNKELLRRYRVFSLLQDRKGLLWFGTIGAGIYTYDRNTFKNMTEENGLVNNDVGCFYEDSKGDIWIGTRVGLSQYNSKGFKNYTFDGHEDDNDINSIAQDPSGNYWIGARGHAQMYDGNAFTKILRENGAPFINVRSIIKDQKGNMWLGGNDGLWMYNGKSFRQFTEDFTGVIFEDSKGKIYVSKSVSGRSYEITMKAAKYLALKKVDLVNYG